jgi:hypothetical protein
MAIIKSSSDHLTINADGASKDIKFQANGVEKASISSAGAFTSTTIDATKLTGALPAISGAALTGVGKVLQVIDAVYAGEKTSTTTSYADTGLTATITLSNSSNKVLVIVNQQGLRHYGGNTSVNVKLQKDSVDWKLMGARISNMDSASPAANSVGGTGGSFIDSPGDTSAHTYKTVYSNRAGTGSVRCQDDGAVSSIILMEIQV